MQSNRFGLLPNWSLLKSIYSMHIEILRKVRNIFMTALLSFLFSNDTLGQCPSANFSLPGSICAGEPIPFTNSSANSSSYHWDFTPGFFRNAGVKLTDTACGVQYPRDITIEEQNDTVVGFYCGGNTMFRVIYANGLSQPLTSIENLGDLGVLYQPSDVALFKENNEWYGLVVDYGNYSLNRFHLGTSLMNTPDNVSQLFNNTNSNITNPWSIKIIADSTGNVFAMATNFTVGTFTLYEFGNSILNAPTANTPVTIPGASNVLDGIFVQDCGNYYAYFSGYSTTNIVKADFGSTISTSPTFTNLISDGSPSDLALVRDSSGWKMVTSNYTTSDIRKYDLGSSLSGTTATLIGTDAFGGSNPKGLAVLRKDNHQYVVIQNISSFNLQVVDYVNNTNVTSATSTDSIPVNISFNTSGTYPITLTAFDIYGNSSSLTQQIQVVNAPISAFEALNLCFGDSVNFIDSTTISGGTISSWNWDFGDGNTSSIQNPVHLFAAAGTYNVSLTTSSGTCDNTLIKQITIAPVPSSNFSATAGCSNTILPFTDLSTIPSGSIVSWSWNFGNGDTSTIQNPVYSFPTGGNYLVSLTVVSDGNCSSSYSTNLVVNSSPIAAFTEINTCIGQQVNFSNQTNPNGSTIIGYNWNFGDGNTDTIFSPNHTYPNAIGNYFVEYIVNANNGCNDTIIKEIRISNIPTANFSLLSDTLCQGNTVQFTDLSSVVSDTISAWSWDFGDSEIDSVASPIHSYSTPGTYTINLIAYSPSNCASSPAQQIITVLESPNASFTYSSTCLGTTTTFTDLSTPASGSSIVSYLWNLTPDDSSIFSNTFFAYDSIGTYPVSLTVVSIEGCIDIAYDTVTIHPQPIAAFSTNLACSRQNVQFTNQSTCDSLSSIAQNIWNFGDFSSSSNTSTLTNPTHQYDTTFNYNASLITITNFGCSDTAFKTIRVNQTPSVQFTYSPTCFGDLMEFFNPGSPIDSLYFWNFGDSQTNQLKEPAHYYISATNYQVTLTVTSTRGCTASATKLVTVSPIPVPQFATTGGCLGSTYVLTDASTISSGSITSYEWNIQEPNIDLTGPSVNYTFSDTGNYHVTLNVISDIGCDKSITQVISIHSLPIANFSFDPQYGNPPLAVQFTDQSQNANSFEWTFGVDSFISFEENPPYLYNDTGLFTITQIVTSSFGCKDTMQKNIYVIKPILDIAITGDSSYQDNDFFYIVATISNLGTLEINNVLMEARLTDGNTIREKMERTIPNGPSGIQNYYFTAAFRLSSGINSDSYCITAIDPNGQTDDIPTNNEKCYSRIDELTILNPFPNPASDQANIRIILPYKSGIEISLFDQTGRLTSEIFNGLAPEGYSDYKIYTQTLPEGIYTIRVIFKEKVYYRQIVVAHSK